MANTPQAKKRARQSEAHRQHNTSMRSMLRTHIKKVIQAIEERNKDAAVAAFKVAEPLLNKMACSGIIHKNKAARHKSRLNKRIKEMGQSA